MDQASAINRYPGEAQAMNVEEDQSIRTCRPLARGRFIVRGPVRPYISSPTILTPADPTKLEIDMAHRPAQLVYARVMDTFLFRNVLLMVIPIRE